MQLSRRRLLSSLGVGVAVGTAGCGAVDRVSSFGGGESLPAGGVDESMVDTIYEPGRCLDVSHRMVTVRDLASLREHDDEVAASLSWQSQQRAGRAFVLDAETIETFAQYGTARLFTGTFDRESALEAFRENAWTVDEQSHGMDVLAHTESPDRYAAGVGDGFAVTASRYRTVHPVEFVRAHAGARAGETERYRSRPPMAELLSAIGGGDYVSAITAPSDVGYRLPHSRAVGRSLAFGGDDITDTIAFYVDESAPEPPETYAEEYAEQWSEGAAGGLLSGPSSGAQGRVAHFSAPRSPSAFTGDGDVAAAIRSSGPTAPMQERLDERYAEEHGLDLPGVTFSYRSLDDGAETACGEGSNAVEVVHESGPAVLARRIVVGVPRTGEIYRARQCGYDYDDEIEEGDTLRAGFRSDPGSLGVFWVGPHGTQGQLPTQRQ